MLQEPLQVSSYTASTVPRHGSPPILLPATAVSTCVVGTLHYMAPEVVKNPLKDHPDDFKNEVRYHYNVVVDSWAVGCLAYELLAGYPPFSANTQQQVVHNINNMDVQYTKRMSEDAVSFIKSALEKHPHDRATSTELIKHPWILQHMVSLIWSVLEVFDLRDFYLIATLPCSVSDCCPCLPARLRAMTLLCSAVGQRAT